MKHKILLLAVFSMLLVSCVCAQGIDLTRQNRLDFDHLIYISNISFQPAMVAPGQSFQISFKITNEGDQFVRDIITKLALPDKVSPYNGVSSDKRALLNSGESADMLFNLIVAPDTIEGLYKIPVTVEYVNHIGDDREENETLTLIVSSKPNLFAEVKATDIYQGNEIGKVSITIANNDIANIKFLTVELKDGAGFTKVNSDTVYVGDLDSDDTQGIDFKISVNKGTKEVDLPLHLTYKDSMNKDYSEDVIVKLFVRTPGELGIKNNTPIKVFFVLVIIGLAAFWYYRRHKKSKAKKAMTI
jgi:hypothetical protein